MHNPERIVDSIWQEFNEKYIDINKLGLSGVFVLLEKIFTSVNVKLPTQDFGRIMLKASIRVRSKMNPLVPVEPKATLFLFLKENLFSLKSNITELVKEFFEMKLLYQYIFLIEQLYGVQLSESEGEQLLVNLFEAVDYFGRN